MKQILLFIGILFSGFALHAQIDINIDPDPLVVCDDNNDGYAFFDLHQADQDITLGNSTLFVTYHIDALDAQTAVNALSSPYMNQVPYFDTVYARVEDEQQTEYVIVLLNLLVQELPQIIQPINLVAIDDNYDGIAIFDLTENETVMLEGLDPSGYDVTYYLSLREALAEEFPIDEPMAYQNLGNPQTIYVRVQNIDRGCFVVASFIISVDSLSIDSFGLEDLNIFPNPASDSFSIQSSQLVSEATVSIYDIQGRMVSSEKRVSQNGTIDIQISSLEKGIYFVKISSEGNMAVRRLIKG